MKRDDIKVVAPAKNPHICYIPRSYEARVIRAKDKTHLSMYRMICESAGEVLSEKSKIHSFKKRLRLLGYKTIGEWVTEMIDRICEDEREYVSDIPKPTMRKEAVE